MNQLNEPKKQAVDIYQNPLSYGPAEDKTYLLHYGSLMIYFDKACLTKTSSGALMIELHLDGKMLGSVSGVLSEHIKLQLDSCERTELKNDRYQQK